MTREGFGLKDIFKSVIARRMKDLKKQVAELIKQTRKAKGLTQEELGEKIGVSKGTYNRYENKSSNLSIETIEKLADALGVKATLIFE